MLQAYIKPDRQAYTHQKDLPDLNRPPNSREIQDDESEYRFSGCHSNSETIQQIMRHVKNLDARANMIYRVTSTRGIVDGCRINKGAILDVVFCGSVSKVIVYGTLVVGNKGHVSDVVLKGHGRLILRPGGSAKRVYKEGQDSIIEKAPCSALSVAKYSRVLGFPINI